MVSFMSSTFTTGERRKKVTTYGKSSRPPPPRPTLIDEDAPSPERPHRHTATLNGPLAGSGGLSKSARPSGSGRVAKTSSDVFDVPSEDEFGFESTPPTKRPVIQRSKTEGGSRVNIAKKTASVPTHPAATASRPPQKSVVAKPAEPTRSLREQSRPQLLVQERGAQSKVMPTSIASQTKASQATEGQKQAAVNGQRLQRSNTSSKDASRSTTPGESTQLIPKRQPGKTTSTVPSNKIAKPAIKPHASLDVFDVPSDDEEVSLPIPKGPNQTPRQVSKGAAKQTGASKISSLDISQKAPVKSNDLGSLQNRKRKGSVSLAAAYKPVAERMQETSKTQRDRKVPKRQEGRSPGHESARAPISHPAPQAVTLEATINKPRRTRTRTVPVVSQLAMSKAQSSPAVLNKMLPVEQAPRVSHQDTPAEVPASDDTMYDIPNSITTPVRPVPLHRTTTSTPGSVTPRQKNLFSTLLRGSVVPKTPASALASLQLTEKKPRSLLDALARSKSDISHSSQSRKARLIHTLKDKDMSSDEDDSESDQEADSTIFADVEMDKNKTPMQTKRTIVVETDNDDLLMNETTRADFQTSQMTSGAITRPKLTYATQRSYLQEANPEDEFLMSMDLDDSWKMDSQTVSTDDEDGPTSQPRTHHELRKYGQNTMFSWDMEESIREISGISNRSVRRSAMMDLCTKMVDAGFVSQLLDSGFMHKLLENMTSTGDVIFDSIAAVSVLFVLQTKPTFAVVDQIYRSDITTSLANLVEQDADISRIARDRKSNMSKIAQESLTDFRALVLASKVWSSTTPEKMSPQLLALKTIDILIRNLRESGSTEALLASADVSKVVMVCSSLSNHVKTTKLSLQDVIALDLAISILETVSIVEQDYSTWPTKVLQHLSEVIAIFFEDNGLTKTVEAMKLCMNLTNNKPKACQPFSTQAFAQSLLHFIVGRFDLLHTGHLNSERRKEVLATLTLALGAMINLAELSDQARLNTIDNTNSIEALVNTFVLGSQRAAEASSVEESEVSVVIGFLTVLLGMLCLNTTVRSSIQALLPNQQLYLVLENMKEFARIHEHVDKRTASRFKGPEGQETLNNYYLRIMHVVRKLESAKA